MKVNFKFISTHSPFSNEEHIEQANHWSIPHHVNKVPRVLITPMRPRWANDEHPPPCEQGTKSAYYAHEAPMGK